MAWRPVCLEFELSDGAPIFLHPISAMLAAMNRRRRDTILQWEEKQIIPLNWQIFIKLKKHQSERFYTDRQVEQMTEWFADNPEFAQRTNYGKASLPEEQRMKIRDLWRVEYDRFQGAAFVRTLSEKQVAQEKRRKAKEKKHVVGKAVFQGEESLFEQIEDERDRADFSY